MTTWAEMVKMGKKNRPTNAIERRSAVCSGRIIGSLRLCFADLPLPQSGLYCSCKVKKMFGYPKIQYEEYRENASNSIEDGRGNLRSAKMICTPTVGIGGDAIAVQMSSHCRHHAHTVHPACLPPKEILRFLERRGVPRRYGLREIELRD